MNSFKKDLNDIAKTLKTLMLKIEKLQKQFSEMEKKHPKAPARKAAAKKTVARKAVVKKPTRRTPAKKTVTRKPVAKKAAPKKGEATAAVIAIINRSKKGVDTATVMKKTGFDKKKVANIFARTKKQGKIKNAGKGRYVKA